MISGVALSQGVRLRVLIPAILPRSAIRFVIRLADCEVIPGNPIFYILTFFRELERESR